MLQDPGRRTYTSDNALLAPYRFGPDQNRELMAQHSLNEAQKDMKMQCLKIPGRSGVTMMYHEEQCGSGWPHETYVDSHGTQQDHLPYSFDCNYLPSHSNSSFPATQPTTLATSTNTPTIKQSIDLSSIDNSMALPVMTDKQYQIPSYDQQRSFVPTTSNMIPLHLANAQIFSRQRMPQQTNTPPGSAFDSPNGMFSVLQPSSSHTNGFGEVPTPPSTVDGNEQAFRQQNKMSPTFTLNAEDYEEQEEVSRPEAASLAESLDGREHSQAWTERQQYSPMDSTYPGLKSAINQGVKFLDNQHLVTENDAQYFATSHGWAGQDVTASLSPTTTSTSMQEPIFGQQEYTVPASFNDLHSETFNTHESMLTPIMSMYPAAHFTGQYAQGGHNDQVEFDFNTAPYNTYPPMLAAIPSNGYAASDADTTTNTSSRGRNGNRDAEMDEKIVLWRSEGLSYKEIKRRGNFDLEESTLRGRHRTLTKSKAQRVRKPAWSSKAERALLEGVEAEAPTSARKPRSKEALEKVPWKKVAQWMVDNRNTYHYGNSTVKKKYVEMIKLRQGSVATSAFGSF